MRFDIQTAPDGSVTAYPTGNGTVTLDQLLVVLEADNSLTRGDGIAAVTALTDLIARELTYGNYVTIDGLGTFGVSLATGKAHDEDDLQDQPDTQRGISGRDVHVKRVTFKASPRLMQYINEHVRFERVRPVCRRDSVPHYTFDKRRALLPQLYRQCEPFTSIDYASFTNVGHTTAHQDLLTFEREGLIKARHVGSAKLYYRGDNAQANT